MPARVRYGAQLATPPSPRLSGRPRAPLRRQINGNRIAYDLSQDAATAPFFEPGFAHPPRSVHVSPIYLSADVHKWVVAYVTPVVTAGDKRAILHFEHGLDVFQTFLTRDLPATQTRLLAVDRRGYVVVDSARQLPIVERDGVLSVPDGVTWRGAHANVEDWTLLVIAADSGQPR
jgi:hypothetical protein